MAAIDDLRAAVGVLQGDVTAENTELASVVTALQAATQQIADLQAQIAAGGTVTEADLEALAGQITAVAQSAADATSAAGGSPAPGA